MSAFVPPHGSGSATAAQTAARTGTPGKKRNAASAGFADALLSLVPQAKGTDAKTAAGTAARKTASASQAAARETPAARQAVPRKDGSAPRTAVREIETAQLAVRTPASTDPVIALSPAAAGSKPSGSGGTPAAASPAEKRTEKDIRRKDRTAKTPREASPSPAGQEAAQAALTAFTAPADRTRETARQKKAAPDSGGIPAASMSSAQGIPVASAFSISAAPGNSTAPSAGGTVSDPTAARTSARSREKSQNARQKVASGARKAEAPPSSAEKRPDGISPEARIAGRTAVLSAENNVSASLPVEGDRTAADLRTEGPPGKRPAAETTRADAASANVSPRPATADAARTMVGIGPFAPYGSAPAGDFPKNPPAAKTGAAPDDLPRKGGDAAPGGAAAAPRGGKKAIPGAEVPLPAAASGRAVDSREPSDPRPARPAEPGKGDAFAGLLAASPVDGDVKGAGAADASAAALPQREQPPPAPLFQQVAMKMTPLPDGAHDVEIRLSPEHLGNLRIELHIDSGRMDASLRADTNEARALLLREEPALREALRNAGVTLSSFNVALSGESWRERRGTARPDADADSPSRRNRRDEPVDGVASAGDAGSIRDTTGGTEHWIA